MSEEEIIRIVSNLINEVFTGKLINMTKMAESYETNRQAIQGLLDLYNKEKEKNKNLLQDNLDLINLYKRTAKHLLDNGKEDLGYYFYAQIGECVTIGTMDIIRKYDFISKDKIKDKAKEFDKPLLDIAQEQKFGFKYTLDGLSAIQQAVTKVLEDLLKED